MLASPEALPPSGLEPVTMRTALLVALLAATAAACGPQGAASGSAAASASTPAAEPTAGAPAAVTPTSDAAAASADGSGIPMRVADLPAYIGPGQETRTVNCQVFTALQLNASTGADAERYRDATDAWALQNRREQNGDRDAAAQYFASTMAPYANQTMGVMPPDVLRAAADQCVAAAPPATS